jgi:type I restriction enzyme S subunit
MSPPSLKDEFKKLTEVGSVSRGKSRHRPRNDPQLYGGPYPFVQTGDVKAAPFYLNKFDQTYNEKGLAQSKLWPSGTLCITIAANIADTAILSIPACFPDSIIGFIAYPEKSDTRYVKYCLDTYKQRIQAISQGTTQDNLSVEKLLSFRFRIPGRVAQQKIAAVLSAYDDLIENNRRRIALLERMAEQLYREWFVRFRFPRYQQAKFEKGVPEDWHIQPSSEFVEVMSGGTPKTDMASYWNGDIPFFTPKDASENFYVLDTEKKVSPSGLEACNSKLYPKNTIFITARGTVGKLILAHRDMVMNQSCYALAPKNADAPFFHFLALKTAVSTIKGVSNSGVFDNIVVDTFKVVPIRVPPDDLVRSFNKLMTPIFEQIESLLSANVVLAKTRDLLLPRLISGKLRVDDLDIQFPPSMQTERA